MFRTLLISFFLTSTALATTWTVDDDGQVNVNDLLSLIAVWDTSSPVGDINYDGTVNIEDLLILIAAWGPCE